MDDLLISSSQSLQLDKDDFTMQTVALLQSAGNTVYCWSYSSYSDPSLDGTQRLAMFSHVPHGPKQRFLERTVTFATQVFPLLNSVVSLLAQCFHQYPLGVRLLWFGIEVGGHCSRCWFLSSYGYQMRNLICPQRGTLTDCSYVILFISEWKQ